MMNLLIPCSATSSCSSTATVPPCVSVNSMLPWCSKPYYHCMHTVYSNASGFQICRWLSSLKDKRDPFGVNGARGKMAWKAYWDSESRLLDPAHFKYPPTVSIPQSVNAAPSQSSQRSALPEASTSAAAPSAATQTAKASGKPHAAKSAEQIDAGLRPTEDQPRRWEQLAADPALHPSNPSAEEETASSPLVTLARCCHRLHQA